MDRFPHPFRSLTYGVEHHPPTLVYNKFLEESNGNVSWIPCLDTNSYCRLTLRVRRATLSPRAHVLSSEDERK